MFVGKSNVRLSKEDFDHAKAGGKPTAMALRFVDKLFSKETLRKSTVHGTKEFTALDPKVMAAIRCKLFFICIDRASCFSASVPVCF